MKKKRQSFDKYRLRAFEDIQNIKEQRLAKKQRAELENIVKRQKQEKLQMKARTVVKERN